MSRASESSHLHFNLLTLQDSVSAPLWSLLCAPRAPAPPIRCVLSTGVTLFLCLSHRPWIVLRGAFPTLLPWPLLVHPVSGLLVNIYLPQAWLLSKCWRKKRLTLSESSHRENSRRCKVSLLQGEPCHMMRASVGPDQNVNELCSVLGSLFGVVGRIKWSYMYSA